MMPLDAEICWQAVAGRDATHDGSFFYGVLTTGVFCRPSCAARTPKRENVRFYRTPDEAERDGLRACLRCKPLDPGGMRERMLALCRHIEQNAGESLTLEQLGRVAGMSPAHLQRTFKAVVGVSPKQYLDNWRLRGFKASLREGEADVTGTIFDAGFGSLSRLYEKVDTHLGMTPMEYRAGGRGLEITYALSRTPLGLLLLGATDRGLCFLQFGDDERVLLEMLRAEYPAAVLRAMPEPPPESYSVWMAALNRHLEGQSPDLRLPVHVRGTAFQLKVWRYLQSIPAGTVESYQEVAKGIGQPAAARAVARACASNMVALAIPCHRVIRGTGALGGYRWGVDRKRVLLDRERTQAAASAIT